MNWFEFIQRWIDFNYNANVFLFPCRLLLGVITIIRYLIPRRFYYFLSFFSMTCCDKTENHIVRMTRSETIEPFFQKKILK